MAASEVVFEPWEDWMPNPLDTALQPLGDRRCCRRNKRRCGPPVQHAGDWVYAPPIRLAKGTGWLEPP